MGELNRPDSATAKAREKANFALVVDHVRSGLNVGSFFRTADGFGAREIIIVGLSPVPPNREVLKTALGATESVNWRYFEDAGQAVDYLKSSGYKVLAIEQTTASVMLNKVTPLPGEIYALVFGNEVDGVSGEFLAHADGCIEIPQAGMKHSLNVAVCAGIVSWHFCQSQLT